MRNELNIPAKVVSPIAEMWYQEKLLSHIPYFCCGRPSTESNSFGQIRVTSASQSAPPNGVFTTHMPNLSQSPSLSPISEYRCSTPQDFGFNTPHSTHSPFFPDPGTPSRIPKSAKHSSNKLETYLEMSNKSNQAPGTPSADKTYIPGPQTPVSARKYSRIHTPKPPPAKKPEEPSKPAGHAFTQDAMQKVVVKVHSSKCTCCGQMLEVIKGNFIYICHDMDDDGFASSDSDEEIIEEK
ncbi:hypothetical protein BJ508DRAFT_308875 [Ascobolus immersus RN42]|uniref:Uncharacterized protein n=1 Tax=Ascobolus immersus RN42 TaxID=1160509 RepID=A0A3N4I3R5_ASCIM|nr:hypothetical protein BJ508DRAFT_308875 [Ascobolus immersus RN42]